MSRREPQIAIETVLAAVREGIAQFWLDNPEQDFRAMDTMVTSTLRAVPDKKQGLFDEKD